MIVNGLFLKTSEDSEICYESWKNMEVAWKYHEHGMKVTWKYYGNNLENCRRKAEIASAEAENLWN